MASLIDTATTAIGKIVTNGKNAITGALLNDALNSIFNGAFAEENTWTKKIIANSSDINIIENNTKDSLNKILIQNTGFAEGQDAYITLKCSNVDTGGADGIIKLDAGYDIYLSAENGIYLSAEDDIYLSAENSIYLSAEDEFRIYRGWYGTAASNNMYICNLSSNTAEYPCYLKLVSGDIIISNAGSINPFTTEAKGEYISIDHNGYAKMYLNGVYLDSHDDDLKILTESNSIYIDGETGVEIRSISDDISIKSDEIVSIYGGSSIYLKGTDISLTGNKGQTDITNNNLYLGADSDIEITSVNFGVYDYINSTSTKQTYLISAYNGIINIKANDTLNLLSDSVNIGKSNATIILDPSDCGNISILTQYDGGDDSSNVKLGTHATKNYLEFSQYDSNLTTEALTINSTSNIQKSSKGWGAYIIVDSNTKGLIAMNSQSIAIQHSGSVGINSTNGQASILGSTGTQLGTTTSNTSIQGKTITSNVSITTSSDIRYKNILNDITLSVEDIANAPFFEFSYKDSEDVTFVGTSAQYWQDICPKAVVETEGKLSLNYSGLALGAATTVAKEVVELKKENETLKAENKAIKTELETFKAELNELKNIINNLK
jgi:hypothetical protein